MKARWYWHSWQTRSGHIHFDIDTRACAIGAYISTRYGFVWSVRFGPCELSYHRDIV